jgi:hypothetical protein
MFIRMRLRAQDRLFKNGASAARIAIDSGCGDCFAASSKKPSVRALLGLGPVGIITK